jgi:hypothetical protein
VKYGQTELHPVAALITLAMIVALLAVRRDRTVVVVLIVACFVTHAQRLVVGGLDFSMLRLMIVFGWIRVVTRGETSTYRFHPVDAALPVWQFFATLAYILGPRASADDFVWRLGLTLDSVGLYFLFRVLLRDSRDIQRAISGFSWIALIMVGPMIIEAMTGRNAFSAFGGVDEITHIRRGRLRCQASFSHPIMAGTFGASSAALIGALWLAFPRQRLLQGAAFVSALVITVLSASSGPAMALIAAVVGWGIWPFREHIKLIRWSSFGVLTGLHFVMDKPVWHLIGRLGNVMGGTGFHRYKLIDEFFAHFDEWWLFGTVTTRHWKIGATANDITNQYAIEGIRGGLASLLSFVSVLVLSFRAVGGSMDRAAAMPGWSRRERRRGTVIAWGLGVCLFVHSVAFIGVSYFGQMMAIFYLHLALIPSLHTGLAREAKLRRAAMSPERSEPRPREEPAHELAGSAAPNLARL